jgi:acetyl esterase
LEAHIAPVVLEPIAQAFIDALAAAGAPPLYTLSPPDARAALDRMQADPIAMAPADIEEQTIPGGPSGEVAVTVVRPLGVSGPVPLVLYIHGGGWILGTFATHERLVRDLAYLSGAAFVFVNYPRSPDARFPVALEQAYAVAAWLARHGAQLGLDGSRMAIAGDSVGGDMATAVTLLAKERGAPVFRSQALFYPVADGAMDTVSYDQFAEGPWLTRKAMAWFWDAYLPDKTARLAPTASPLRAPLAMLAGLLPALVITAEADVLRDEGEAHARRLREAGVDVLAVRYAGAFHDFMILNDLAETNAARAATVQAAQTLKTALAG